MMGVRGRAGKGLVGIEGGRKGISRGVFKQSENLLAQAQHNSAHLDFL